MSFSSCIFFFFLGKYEFSLNRNSKTQEISKPSIFKRSWEIIREIHDRGARQRNQLSKCSFTQLIFFFFFFLFSFLGLLATLIWMACQDTYKIVPRLKFTVGCMSSSILPILNPISWAQTQPPTYIWLNSDPCLHPYFFSCLMHAHTHKWLAVTIIGSAWSTEIPTKTKEQKSASRSKKGR